ncbi:hypothetical protein HKD37_16G044749 [Glycine soja]
MSQITNFLMSYPTMVLVILYALFTNNAITTATQFVHLTTPQAYHDIDHVLRKNLKIPSGPNPLHHAISESSTMDHTLSESVTSSNPIHHNSLRYNKVDHIARGSLVDTYPIHHCSMQSSEVVMV